MKEKSVIKLNAGKSDADGVITTERTAGALQGVVLCEHDIRDIMSGMVDSSKRHAPARWQSISR